jgi:hypothetical protein
MQNFVSVSTNFTENMDAHAFFSRCHIRSMILFLKHIVEVKVNEI